MIAGGVRAITSSRLAVAALGMFNRGRQDVGEEELGEDLEADPRAHASWTRSRASRGRAADYRGILLRARARSSDDACV